MKVGRLLDDRGRQHDRQTRRPTGENRQEVDVEVVEVLMGDEQPVDPIGERLGGRRREETRLVLAEERVDQDPEPLGLEQEPGLPQPRQRAHRHDRRSRARHLAARVSDVVGRQRRATARRLPGEPCGVGREDHVLELGQRVVNGERLLFVDVEACSARSLPFRERLDASAFPGRSAVRGRR